MEDSNIEAVIAIIVTLVLICFCTSCTNTHFVKCGEATGCVTYAK